MMYIISIKKVYALIIDFFKDNLRIKFKKNLYLNIKHKKLHRMITCSFQCIKI